MKELKKGEPWWGETWDPRAQNAQRIPAVLSRTARGNIQLEILAREEDKSAFFPREGSASRLNSFVDFSNAAAPKFLSFASKDGNAALYGVRFWGQTQNSNMHRELLRCEASFVILGTYSFRNNGGYQRIDGEISGLFNWMGRAALASRRSFDDVGPDKIELQTEVIANPPFELKAAGLGRLRLWSDANVNDSGTLTHLGPRVLFRSIGRSEFCGYGRATWSDAMAAISGLRDLLIISEWELEEIVQLRVTFQASSPTRWYPLEPYGLDLREPERAAKYFHLFPFDELGQKGIERWFEFLTDSDLSRVVKPLALLRRSEISLDGRILILGSIIDALAGYLLRLEIEWKYKGRGAKSNCSRVAQFAGIAMTTEQKTVWIDRMSELYNLIKHSDKKPTPNGNAVEEKVPFEKSDVANIAQSLIRISLGKLLGMSDQSLLSRLKEDPHRPERWNVERFADPSEVWPIESNA